MSDDPCVNKINLKPKDIGNDFDHLEGDIVAI